MEISSKEFQKKVEQELVNLTREQIVLFAWRCAIRAIPFLGVKGNFDFWEKPKRQKYIFIFFNVSDLIYVASKAVRVASAYAYAADVAADALSASAVRSANTAAINAVNAACAAVKAAADAVKAADASKAFADTLENNTIETIKAIAQIIKTAADTANYASEIDTPLRTIVIKEAAKTATKTVAIKTVFNTKINNLENDILTDIVSIKNEKGNQVRPRDIIGEVWNNFLKALERENCVYWGRMFQNIFETGFKLNQKSLESRIQVPNEIKSQGASVIANYLEELEKGSQRLNETRIIILGEKGAGKTCLARRLIDPNAPMTKVNESTAGVDTSLWELEDDEMNIRIWDFAGHVVTHAVHQFFLSERCLYIMVYDGRTEERNRLEYWLNHMKNHGGDSKAIILVNKRDKNKPDITINNLKEKYPIIGFFEFSIKNDKVDLENFRSYVTSYIKKNTSWNKQEIPKSYYNVKEELERLFSKCNDGSGLEHITKERFIKIANKYDVKDNDKLLKDLHFLGVSLWYDEMEEYNTMVLNPEWISDGVYTIINWVFNTNNYSIRLEEFNTVFKEDSVRYPNNKHKFLFNLITHYELAYKTQHGDELIIPHLLNEDRPKELPNFHVGESLMLRYKAEQPLPPNTISRFIVRHNQEIKKENRLQVVWRYGVVLENKNSIALVREEDRTISVSVKGDDKTRYISTLRATLNDIFESYKSEKPELQYRVERFGLIPEEVEERTPLWLSDRKIKNHVNNNVSYYDDELGQHIPLDRTVNIYNIDKVIGDHSIIGGQGHNVVNNIASFKDCNIGIQGNLNELSDLLAQEGHIEEAKELQEAAKALEKAEQNNSKEEIKKKGLVNKVMRFLESLEDENSKFHKTVKGIKNGISIAQDIAKGYNDIAQWAGLPQVPKPFLKKEESK